MPEQSADPQPVFSTTSAFWVRHLPIPLLAAIIFALGQQARGAHFVSHDLWTATLCWFGALALFVLFRPQRWVPIEFPGRGST